MAWMIFGGGAGAEGPAQSGNFRQRGSPWLHRVRQSRHRRADWELAAQVSDRNSMPGRERKTIEGHAWTP